VGMNWFCSGWVVTGGEKPLAALVDIDEPS
jgi:hypothetical protein